MAFYRGFSLRVIYVAPAAAVSFFMYEKVKEYLSQMKTRANRELQPLLEEGRGHHRQNFVEYFDTLRPFVAGAVANVLSTAARTPFDIVKQQMQTYAMGQRRKLSLPSAIRRVVHANGIGGLFRGYWVACLRDAPFAGLYFTIYELCKNGFQERAASRSMGGGDQRWETTKSFHHLVSGAVSGFISTCATIPLDVLKTNIQSQAHIQQTEKSMMVVAKELYALDGWRAFIRGWFVCVFVGF